MAHNKVQVIRYAVVHNLPYIRRILFTLQPVETELPDHIFMSVDQAARWYVDSKKLESLPLSELCACTVHEVFHLMNLHFKRGENKKAVNPKGIPYWNIAGDEAINSKFGRDGITCFNLPENSIKPELFQHPKHLTAEDYYQLLVNEEEQQKSNSKKQESKDKDNKDSKEKKEQEKSGCGSCSGQGDFPWEINGGEADPTSEKNPGVCELEISRVAEQVAEDIKKAASANPGNVPASLVRWAEDFLKPKINWRKELQHAIITAYQITKGKLNYSYFKRSRRQTAFDDLILPGFIGNKVHVGIIMDTSGSMGEEELKKGKTEIFSILNKVDCDITLISCDAQVHSSTVVKNKKDIKFTGGGGTYLPVGYEFLSKISNPKVNIIITITDLETRWPKDPIPNTKNIIVNVSARENPYFQKQVPSWAKVYNIGQDLV